MKQGLVVSWEEDFHILVWCCSWDNSSFLFAFHPPLPTQDFNFRMHAQGFTEKGECHHREDLTPLVCTCNIYVTEGNIMYFTDGC
jgi:hypothetical protein